MKMEIPPNNQEIKKNQVEIDLGALGKHNLEILSKNNFEYPEAIQKETGIIGYERTIISKEALRKVHEETGGDNGKELTKEILDKLSDGEFFYLARHTMGGYASEKERETYTQKFADQKFILQKIFDVESIKELGKGNMSSVFSHTQTENSMTFSLFNKSDHKVIRTNISPSELIGYEEELNNGSLFACTTDSGLSDSNAVAKLGTDAPFSLPNFFHDKSTERGRKYYNISSESPSTTVFAFDPTEPHLHKYFLETYNLFIDLNKKNHTNVVGADEDVLLNLYEKINYENMLDISTEEYSREIHQFFDSTEKSFKKDQDYKEKNKYTSRKNRGEGAIPIVIGHEKIKQLRWGDSKYAVFFTEKGLNFLKIKHVDENETPDSSEVIE